MKVGDLVQFRKQSMGSTGVQKQGVILEIQHRLWRPDGAKLLSCEVFWSHPAQEIQWAQQRWLEVINES